MSSFPEMGELSRDPRCTRFAMTAALLLLLAMAAVAPVLEYSNGGENLLVTTALETRRTGRWLVPTMNDARRINKPPLPMWISALAITDSTMAEISSSDPVVRASAYGRLQWQARWPSIVSGAAAVLVAWRLGVTLSAGAGGVGWMAAAICASMLLFIRNVRLATTDVQLMLWVAVANLCIAKSVFDGWRWRGAIGAGLAIGLGMMSKGPVALVQTLAPLIGFVVFRRFYWPLKRPVRAGGWVGPVLVAAVAALAVGLPWYGLILARDPDVAQWWWREVTREGATDLPPGDWYNYLVFLPWLAPWTMFFIVGVIGAVRDVRGTAVAKPPAEAQWPQRMAYAAMLVIVPIVVMSFFRDRKDRYTLPMVIPAAVVAARGFVECAAARVAGGNVAFLTVIHWVVVGVMAVAMPIVGATVLRTVDSRPWFDLGPAIAGSLVFGAVFVVAVWQDRARRRGMVMLTTVLVLLSQVMFLHGYANSREGRSEMRPLAEAVWRDYGSAAVYISGAQPTAVPPDLPLYLNRPVPWMDWSTVASLSPGLDPQVVVVRQREGREPEPPPPGPAWKTMQPVRRDNNLWHAFVLEGRTL